MLSARRCHCPAGCGQGRVPSPVYPCGAAHLGLAAEGKQAGPGDLPHRFLPFLSTLAQGRPLALSCRHGLWHEGVRGAENWHLTLW
jgi:hypothetical protein